MVRKAPPMTPDQNVYFVARLHEKSRNCNLWPAAAGHKLQFLDFSWSLATKYTFWSGVIGGAFLTMATHGTDQTIVQRLLAAKSERSEERRLGKDTLSWGERW